MKLEGIKVIAKNRKASHEYFLEETFQAGLVLMGSEIKSIRANQVNIGDGFVQEQGGEMWLFNVHISPYSQGAYAGHKDPLRQRKLLLHKKEMRQIRERVRDRGYTVIPTMIYLQNGRAKVEIAIAKGKKLYDKRDSIGKRDAEREMRRALKNDY
ncbi:MAG: SsrA-binding protein SmpB [Chloroflexi bacterium]|nr:SsrA-binding protein SmpB [Chloroflexota bacterium]